MANDYHQPHKVVKGNPKVDGPYLDDINADQERAYRERRNKTAAEPEAAPVAEEVTVVVTGQLELPLDESVEDE